LERLEARITPEQKRLIARAAELRGTTVTDFVLASAAEAAARTIRHFEVITLPEDARDVFIRTVLNPPRPNAAARAAARRYLARSKQ
jgi:uncharacterized protein (DUF1778 family)